MMRRAPQQAFALVLVLVLVSVALLVTLALAALTKISHEAARANEHRVQARQNALVALHLAYSELQRTAGSDASVTGMAGITGVSATVDATTRYWTGVWDNTGQFRGWLTSGASQLSNPIALVANGVVGSASSSSNLERQHIVAGKINIPDSAEGNATEFSGRYAYLVIDEGVKIGAYADPTIRASSNLIPRIGSSMLSNQLRLKTAIESAPNLEHVVAYEQLREIATTVTTQALQDCFHYVSFSPRFLVGSELRSGMINVNTSVPMVWRSLLDTYNASPNSVPLTTVTARGNALANGFAAFSGSKGINGPFTTIDAFRTYFLSIFPASSSPSATQIWDVLQPILTVRSDTFRIRAYGEATDASAEKSVTAVAYCEAIVQRTPEMMPDGSGRRFVITYYRWLTPADI